MNNSAVARPGPQISSLCDILGPDTRRNQLQGLKGRGLLLCLPDHSRRACVMPGGGRSTPGYMRYADGGGLTASGRARRATVRLSAAAMSGQDVKPVQVRHELRVNTKSAYQWRRRWRAGGTPALASKGAGGGGAGSAPPRCPGCGLRWIRARRSGAGPRTSGGPWSGATRVGRPAFSTSEAVCMRDAVTEWPTAARRRVPWRLSRSVIDSVGPAVAEFARNADFVRLPGDRAFPGVAHRSAS